ncbi:MAG: PASTA domain-containing protein [Candidatus Eisenbacteria bacterium]|nr:PASTA domain-containing protein [Candidatus Eisenbacteria bacterium]
MKRIDDVWREEARRARRRFIVRGRMVPLLGLLLGGLLGIVLFDRVLMPRVVRHGSDAEVPGVVGLRGEQVAERLEDAGLQVGRISEVRNGEVAEGSVLSQDPPEGARVRKGRPVNLLVSGGIPETTVPDLTGMTPRHAKLELNRVGLTAGAVLSLPSDLAAEGEVLSTRPGKGERSGGDGTVDLIVSGGAPVAVYVMPDLRGKDRSEAIQTLGSAGIRVAGYSPGGIVNWQQPAPGSPIRAGQTVQLD